MKEDIDFWGPTDDDIPVAAGDGYSDYMLGELATRRKKRISLSKIMNRGMAYVYSGVLLSMCIPPFDGCPELEPCFFDDILVRWYPDKKEYRWLIPYLGGDELPIDSIILNK